VRLNDRLFTFENPSGGDADFRTTLNPNSLETLTNAAVEPALAQAAPGTRFQFERLGYFCVDTVDSKPGAPVFNRTVALKDGWSKIAGK
jgi:glutaminyl-tRNA synthetase